MCCAAEHLAKPCRSFLRAARDCVRGRLSDNIGKYGSSYPYFLALRVSAHPSTLGKAPSRDSAAADHYTSSMKPRTLILRTAGTNCDQETGHAFELAGSETTFLHVNRLLENPAQLHDYQLLAIPGGFSYGDDIAAGRIFANQIAHHLLEPLHRFV